jgi:hypothetical protein
VFKSTSPQSCLSDTRDFCFSPDSSREKPGNVIKTTKPKMPEGIPFKGSDRRQGAEAEMAGGRSMTSAEAGTETNSTEQQPLNASR